jgi:hypothetical protein
MKWSPWLFWLLLLLPLNMLLQVGYIVSCVAASEYLGSKTKIDDWAYSQWDISSLFGSVPLNHSSMKGGKVNGMAPATFNKVSQVWHGVWKSGTEVLALQTVEPELS